MIHSVKNQRLHHSYEVQVFRDGSMWIGICDALGLVTEAVSYEALTQRVREIAPDLAEGNGLPVDSEGIRLSFRRVQMADSLIAM